VRLPRQFLLFDQDDFGRSRRERAGRALLAGATGATKARLRAWRRDDPITQVSAIAVADHSKSRRGRAQISEAHLTGASKPSAKSILKTMAAPWFRQAATGMAGVYSMLILQGN
jgi:hypothetical protein